METGLFPSRAKAQEAIAAGLVAVDSRGVGKPAARVASGARLAARAPYPWVSRGGVKLAAALDVFGIDPRGRICLDVGASTGGFTDVLLTRGAARVYAVDVGHGQLHPRIAADPRVEDWAGTDVRALTVNRFADPPSLIVCDTSFISLSLVLPAILPLAVPTGCLVTLVKPQFEVGRGGTHKGIVREPDRRMAACTAVQRLLEGQGWTVLGLHPSPIAGSDGNIEYLIAALRP